jgi:hypothetical protein
VSAPAVNGERGISVGHPALVLFSSHMRARAAVISALAITLVLVLPTEAWAKPKPPRADADAIRACHLNNQLATVVLLGNSNPQDPPYASMYATVANQSGSYTA